MSRMDEVNLGQLRDRIWALVRVDSRDKCWLWLGVKATPTRKSSQRYGQFNVRVGPRKQNRTVSLLAHRLIYSLHYGSLRDDDLVLHKCSNALCCNPHHLYIGTHQNNMDDMKEIGNSLAGESNPRSKLTQDQVDSIRSIPITQWWSPANKSGWTLKKLAKKYGVSFATISLIRRGETWHPARGSNSSHRSDNPAASPEAQRGSSQVESEDQAAVTPSASQVVVRDSARRSGVRPPSGR